MQNILKKLKSIKTSSIVTIQNKHFYKFTAFDFDTLNVTKTNIYFFNLVILKFLCMLLAIQPLYLFINLK